MIMYCMTLYLDKLQENESMIISEDIVCQRLPPNGSLNNELEIKKLIKYIPEMLPNLLLYVFAFRMIIRNQLISLLYMKR